MNKKIVNEIISDVIVEKLTQVVEEMSTNEFIELICDKVSKELNTHVGEEETEEIQEMIGNKVLPLFHKLSEYIVETNVVGGDKE